MYTREKLKGKPFLDHVVSRMGGWDVLGTWDEASWDLNTALKMVQGEFWTDALFTPYVGIDLYDIKKKSIQLSPAGTGKWMYWSWYTSPHAAQYRQDYRKFIRRVGSLLQRDAKVNMTAQETEDRLDTF